MDNKKFRHEFKYVCTDGQFACLKARLTGVMKYDSHADSNGCYNVRSIYFDDINDTYYYENENGVDPRKKYRIRIYNSSDSIIDLECKSKIRGMTNKESAHISRDFLDEILSGKRIENKDFGKPVLNSFIDAYNNQMLRHKVIVDYERTVFVCPVGNVRITFDRNISSSVDYEHFFNEVLIKRPVMETGKHILEVKYDALLPDYIYKAVELENLQRTTFSKYYLCRNIHM